MANSLRITVDELKNRMEGGEDFTMVDVRKPDVWTESDTMIPESIRVPLDKLEQNLPRIPKNRPRGDPTSTQVPVWRKSFGNTATKMCGLFKVDFGRGRTPVCRSIRSEKQLRIQGPRGKHELLSSRLCQRKEKTGTLPNPIRLLFIIWFIRYLFRTKQAQLRLAVAER